MGFINPRESEPADGYLPPVPAPFLMRVNDREGDEGESPQSLHDDGIVERVVNAPYDELLGFRRYKGAKGGRGGAKSHFFAEEVILNCVSRHTRQACLREVQNSIKDSVKQLLEDKIAKFNVADEFRITDTEIVCPATDSLIIFRGLRKQSVASIKSLEGFTDAWFEEAQTLSKRSVETALPTFRTGSQMSFSWNPDQPTDPVDELFEQNYYEDGDEDFICVEVNYWDNPWFPDELRRDMERDKKRDPEKYHHVWCGGYVANSEARVFKNWRVNSFDTPIGAEFLQGADWGFSVDPTVLVRCFVGRYHEGHVVPDPKGTVLFVDHCAYKIGVELDHTPKFFDQLVKDRGVPVLSELGVAQRRPIIADSANPQAISYVKRHGYPLIKAAIKGPNSIKEGIAFLQNFDIVVHPRCTHVIDELTHFRYKVDEHTKLILPELMTKKNHVIDSLRYAVEPMRKAKSKTLFGSYL